MSFIKDYRKKELKEKDFIRHTKSEFKDECDVNVIMKKYKKNGILPLQVNSEGQYLDVSDIGTYQDCLNVVVNAQSAFENLPSELRRRFGNHIERYLEYVQDSSNLAEMEKLGMIEKKDVSVIQSKVSNEGIVTPK